MLLKPLLIAFSLSALVACAGTSETDSEDTVRRGDCIRQSSIRGYMVLDERNLIVTASARRSYHVTLQRRAHGLRDSWRIAFKSPAGRVCASFSEIVFEGHFDGESIRISSIRELTPEEEEDLLIRFGKKEPEIKHTPAPQEVEGADVEELDPDASE
jgi:hypothetical protein